MVVTDPIEVIQHINPTHLEYDEWLSVGMALKYEGASAKDWALWSMDDPNKYRDGECERKWESFRGSSNPTTIASLVKLAMNQGWKPPRDPGRALGWDETVQHPEEAEGSSKGNGQYKVVDQHWVELEEIPEPGDEWKPIQDLVRYLGILFDSNEYVGYVTESWENEGRYLPRKGNYGRTAGELTQELNRCAGDIGAVIGDAQAEVGAWIRFNPLDGKGVKDANVTAFRFALVECDEISIYQQYALLKELELPIATMVHSGKKSVHAIVRIDADTMEEYRKRVDFLYEVCGRNGLKLDRQNRNPSRLSRMPGITRNGKKQWLIDTNLGKGSWKEWEEWVIDLNDDLPDIVDLVVDHEPELAPELIVGLLREGHKMLLAGPSKSHKSFALIQLTIALAEGRPWMGWETKAGRVLYVNLELDGRSCNHRFWDTYRHLGESSTPGMIDIWNLRGEATRMDKLTPKLIRRAQKKGYKAVIIDPVYKVLTGDENSAEQMANFCNQFDKICKQLDAATIFCHHHSKGAQGQKQSQDRASGSGVFARDPDTIIDLIELDVDEKIRSKVQNRWECDAIMSYLDRQLESGWRQLISIEDLAVSDKLFDWGAVQTSREDLAKVRLQAMQASQTATGWRMEATMREFPPCPTKSMFFRYPFHLLDSEGLLADAKAEGEDPPWGTRPPLPPEERKRRRLEQRDERKQDRMEELEVAIQSNFGDKKPSVQEVAEGLGCTEKTVRNRVGIHPKYCIKKGYVVEVNPDVDEPSGDPPF